MIRLQFSLVSPSALMGSALLMALAACSDSSVSPTAVPIIASPSSVLSIGELRRAVPSTPCKAAPYRQFDFWLGEWSVSADGAFNGTNNVTSELDGCLVAEHWGDVGEVQGWSMNTYDRSTRLWNQHWVDEFGVNLILSGGLQNGSMVIGGTRRFASGATWIERIAYTPLSGGQMRQFWETSTDGGATFAVTFDGLYVPQPGVVPPPAPGTGFCAGPAYRAADFLLGEWRVEATNGLDLGRSSITAELSGCLVLEQFSTPKGYRAKAFLSFGRGAATWTRTYMDSEGGRVFVQGTPVAGGLVLTGTTALPNGDQVMTRVTWTKTAAGTLQQLWEISRDGGASWTVDETLVYVPA